MSDTLPNETIPPTEEEIDLTSIAESSRRETPLSFLTGIAGSGKCLGRGTPILMFDGSIKPAERIIVGDLLMGPDSKPRVVCSLITGYGEMYSVIPTKGDIWVCNVDHQLTLTGTNQNYGKTVDLSIRDYLDACKASSFATGWKLVRSGGIDFQPSVIPLPIDPYLAGVWLGDGGHSQPVFHLNDTNKMPIAEFLSEIAAVYGLIAVKQKTSRKSHGTCIRLNIKGEHKRKWHKCHTFTQVLRTVFMEGKNKIIPTAYMTASREERLKLLAGLIDTDGSKHDGGGLEFCTKYRQISDAVVFICRSLGFASYITIKYVNGRPYYRLSISGDLSCIPCLVAHKKCAPRRQIKRVTVTGFKLRQEGRGDYYGFTISGDGRFLLGDFTITHNSYTIRQRCEADPHYAILCSTTGISAVNLNCSTVNATLRYFDTDSLKDNYIKGRLTSTLRKIAQNYRNLIIDEISMMPADQLTTIIMALDDVNQMATVKTPLGLVCTGDMLQLPPVKAEWCFKSPMWPRIAAHTERLTKNYRQSDPGFLNALNFLRAGDGASAATVLRDLVPFHSSLDESFDGTTIMGKNDEVDRYNRARLMALPGKTINLRSRWWGQRDGSWNNIPEEFFLKDGALVMILSNSGRDLAYCNGDLGHVKEYDALTRRFAIELVRNGEVVKIGPIHRTKISRDEPSSDIWDENEGERFESELGDRPPYGKASYDESLGVWHTGGIQYYPLRAAFASTVHKTQSLTIDNVQVDLRGHFMNANAMVYVAMSRCRSPQGLRLVGSPDLLIKRCNVDPEVREFV